MAAVDSKDSIGQRGESIFCVILTRLNGRPNPIFRPQFLGDKWPTVDFIVELTDYAGPRVPYLFVQVKTTREGYTKRENRLKVRVSEKSAQRLALYPAPTYIVGIDENQETGYIISACGKQKTGLSSLSTRFPINKETQDILWREVVDFWKWVDTSDRVSKFADPDWR